MRLVVRPLREADLDQADRIYRLAFGTFLGLRDPRRFAGDSDYVRTRWHSEACTAFAAEVDGELVGSNFATHWGSVGLFGPLTVRPDLWGRGIAHSLLEPTMETFARWKTTHCGLFTFAESPKHHALYQKFGFYPRFLTPVLAKPVRPIAAPAGLRRFSVVADAERDDCLRGCRAVTTSLYPGLDLSSEIRATEAGTLGDTLLLEEAGAIAGLAVCHFGKGTEAGSETAYVKFAAVRCGSRAHRDLLRLLDSCQALAADNGATRLIVGVNLAREHAYRALVRYGFRAEIVGVAMHSGNDPGYSRPDVFALDDWR
ncbi:MAG TPA: GNAT family N-acetyltransferase [Candidatus Binatia bacterium]|nr:GNAT family N-acetyltransferase [Candidatus Binatia bacterium]